MVYLVLYISHVSKKEKKNASGFTPKAISTVNKEMGGGSLGEVIDFTKGSTVLECFAK